MQQMQAAASAASCWQQTRPLQLDAGLPQPPRLVAARQFATAQRPGLRLQEARLRQDGCCQELATAGWPAAAALAQLPRQNLQLQGGLRQHLRHWCPAGAECDLTQQLHGVMLTRLCRQAAAALAR
jgi:hypothetical protein